MCRRKVHRDRGPIVLGKCNACIPPVSKPASQIDNGPITAPHQAMMPTAYNNMIDIPPQVIPGQLRPALGYQAGSGPTVISAEIAVGSLHAESSLGLRYPEAS